MTDAEFVGEIAQPLSSGANDYDRLLNLISDARFVLLGEATHGTHEFYSERRHNNETLIAKKGFISMKRVRLNRSNKPVSGTPASYQKPIRSKCEAHL